MNGPAPDLPDLKRHPAERLAAAVLPASGAVWAAAEVMHWAGIHAGRDAGIAAAVAAAVFWGGSGRGWSSAPAWFWAAAYCGWFAAAETFGPLAWLPAPMLTALWIFITWRAARYAHGHESVAGAREWREQRERWLTLRGEWNMGGTHLLAQEPTRLGEVYFLSTKDTGHLASFYHENRKLEEWIAEQEDLPPGRVTITKQRLAGRIRVEVRRLDPWAHVLLHPLADDDPEVELPGYRSILDEAMIGQDPATGTVLTVPLADEDGGKNVSVTGIKGSGKGVLLDAISEHVTGCGDALMIRINVSVKGYAEAESWGPSCHLTAFGPEQKSRAAAVLKVVEGIIEWRSKTYKRGQYRPSPQDPAVVVIFDESDSAAEVTAIRAGMNMIATKGREYWVSYAHAGQRGTSDYTSAKSRSQDDVYCTGLVKNANEQRHAGSRSGPDMAAYGEGAKGVWKVERLGGGLQAGRTWVFADSARGHAEEVERIAAERALSQPELPAACREYLGPDYERLLATEVFAAWAHAQEGGPGDGEAPSAEPPAQDGPPEPRVAPEPSASAAPAVRATMTAQDDFDDRWLEMNVETDPESDDRVAALRARLDASRQALEDAAARPRVRREADPEALAALTAERWRQVGEDAQIPEGAHGRLMALLQAGTTASALMSEFGITRWTARTWLQKFRNAGIADVQGDGRARCWRLTPPPGDAGVP